MIPLTIAIPTINPSAVHVSSIAALGGHRGHPPGETWAHPRRDQ